mmetsp:Transcript_13168/g.19793  ORF Transcript_13168/g.19793 Transcript_13168/m.19793 type:complete len:409 (-) Transcript_13168:736-1962(-)
MISSLAVNILRELYRNHNGIGKEISKSYRLKARSTLPSEDDHREEEVALTFGEIVPASFLQILQLTTSKVECLTRKSKPKALEVLKSPTASVERVFVDLGSGIGRACFTAALSPCRFTKVWGIEIMSDLTDEAIYLKNILIQWIENRDADKMSPSRPTKVSANNCDLRITIKDILMGSPNYSLPTDELGNQICKRIGHKKYRSNIKPFKSFSNFLNSLIGLDLSENEDTNSLTLNIDSLNTLVTLTLVPKNIINCVHVEHQNDDKEEELLTAGIPSNPGDVSFHCTSEKALTTQQLPLVAPLLTSSELQLFTPMPEIVLQTGDIFEVEWWKEADVVYTASLLFSQKMMESLTKCVLQMKPNSWFISLRPLLLNTNNDGSEIHKVQLHSESFFRMSWQMAKVYIYKIEM